MTRNVKMIWSSLVRRLNAKRRAEERENLRQRVLATDFWVVETKQAYNQRLYQAAKQERDEVREDKQEEKNVASH